MRILHVNHGLTVGGAEVMILDLAREQLILGHEVKVCSMGGIAALDARAKQFGIPVIHLEALSNGLLTKIRRVLAVLSEKRYDVVHMHWGVWLPTALSSKIAGVPCLYTNHGNHSRRTFLEHRLAAAFTDQVAMLTQKRDPYITRWVGVRERKRCVVPNGIDLDRFAGADRVEIDGVPPDAMVIGMTARMYPPKDYPTFIKAAAIVASKHPNVYFLAIGDGPNRATYERLASEELHSDRMRFLGFRSDVPSLVKRMHAQVLATKNEGLGLTLLESMAGGCVAIGSDIPPVRTVLEGGCGLLVPVGDHEALGRAMLRVVEDEELVRNLRICGSERVASYSSRTMARRYEELYKRLVVKRVKSGGRLRDLVSGTRRNRTGA